MIRVRYSNYHVVEYKNMDIAKFMITNILFTSNGKILPVEAVEVLGTTMGGVSVERDLKIRLGVVEFEW